VTNLCPFCLDLQVGVDLADKGADPLNRSESMARSRERGTGSAGSSPSRLFVTAWSRLEPVVRYLKPDFLEELAESCEVEEK